MTTPESKLAQTLAALGSLFRRAGAISLRRTSHAIRRRSLPRNGRTVRSRHFAMPGLARKSGVLTLVTDNWLKPASPELKRAVGAALNELRGHVDSQIAARQSAVEAGAEAPGKSQGTRRPFTSRRHSSRRLASPDSPGVSGNRRHFLFHRLFGRRRPGNRNALLQFRSA